MSTVCVQVRISNKISCASNSPFNGACLVNCAVSHAYISDMCSIADVYSLFCLIRCRTTISLLICTLFVSCSEDSGSVTIVKDNHMVVCLVRTLKETEKPKATQQCRWVNEANLSMSVHHVKYMQVCTLIRIMYVIVCKVCTYVRTYVDMYVCMYALHKMIVEHWSLLARNCSISKHA